MFKFDFDVEEDAEIEALLESQGETRLSKPQDAAPETDPSHGTAVAFKEHSLNELLETLPNTGFSFSPIRISAGHGDVPPVFLSKRDLFDVRFQLIAASAQTDQEQTQEPEDLKFVEAPSDLVPGVYEGGLKTWECSVDLATYLHDSLAPDAVVGKRVLELGCGTAIPSSYLLRQAFSYPPKPERRTSIHLQDYNELVFRLTVLPNMILTWYMSPASTSFRESISTTSHLTSPQEKESEEEESFPPPDPSEPGDLPITPSLITAFRQSLSEHNIDLRFFSGSWETFDLDKSIDGGRKYDIILTSETIYRLDSLPSLLDLMWQASRTGSADRKSLEDLTKEMTISSQPDDKNPDQVQTQRHDDNSDSTLIIVAAKSVYFGVGGGVAEFVDAVENGRHTDRGRRPAKVNTVWEKDGGVKRVIMKVEWR